MEALINWFKSFGEPAAEKPEPMTPEREAEIRARFRARLKEIQREADIRKAEAAGRGGSRGPKHY